MGVPRTLAMHPIVGESVLSVLQSLRKWRSRVCEMPQPQGKELYSQYKQRDGYDHETNTCVRVRSWFASGGDPDPSTRCAEVYHFLPRVFAAYGSPHWGPPLHTFGAYHGPQLHQAIVVPQ